MRIFFRARKLLSARRQRCLSVINLLLLAALRVLMFVSPTTRIHLHFFLTCHSSF